MKLTFSFAAFILAAKPFACEIRADLGFVFDGSESIDDSAKSRQKAFVNAVVGSFKVSKENAQAGIIVTGNVPKLAIRLGEHENMANFEAAVDKMTAVGGKNRLDKALLAAYDELFNASNGARPDVPQILTVITTAMYLDKADGNSLALAASRYHEAGIKLLVLVAGKDANKDLLNKLVQSPTDIFYVERFDELAERTLVEAIAKSACRESGKNGEFSRLFWGYTYALSNFVFQSTLQACQI